MTEPLRASHNDSALLVHSSSPATQPEQISQSLGELSRTAISEVSCWTCRRRRVQCDRLLPTCVKCQHRGLECLGYKKPLVWNKGVASRGKMMGKNFDDTRILPDQHSRPARKLRQSSLNVPVLDEGDCGNQIEALSASPMHPSYPNGHGFRVLVDPIFQDFAPVTRYYLSYYAQTLSPVMVLYDAPGENPFRSVMALVGASPLLLKSILAASARHLANQNKYPLPFLADGLSLAPNPITDVHTIVKPSLYHALCYKQSALRQLRKDLQGPIRPNPSLIIATINIFVMIDILESGKDTWRIHLDAAQKVAQMSDEGNASDDLGIIHLFDTCVILDIMGTSLAQSYMISQPIAPSASIYNCLKRSEKLLFLGCPADILYLILHINWHCWWRAQPTPPTPPTTPPSHAAVTEPSPTPLTAMDPPSIIRAIQAFDPALWSAHTSTQSARPDVTQRTLVASAYQSAVLIHALRVLPPTAVPSPPIAVLAAHVIAATSTLARSDPFFKCVMWPTFIAGAEAETPELRAAVRTLLREFWLEFRSENVPNALVVLEEIWRAEGEGRRGWVEHFAKEGANWLFI